MGQASQQVTPAQVLDAGRRAEADGRVEYAIQFYRHLADHHAAAPEAVAARDALTRLSRRRTMQPGSLARPSSAPPPMRPATPLARAALRGEEVSITPPIRIAPAGAVEPAPALVLPDPARGYLAGRLIASALIVLGLLLIAAGVVVISARTVAPTVLSLAAPWGSAALHPFAGPGAALAGVVSLMMGQLARAVFDAALSMRDLVAIERAKADHLAANAR